MGVLSGCRVTEVAKCWVVNVCAEVVRDKSPVYPGPLPLSPVANRCRALLVAIVVSLCISGAGPGVPPLCRGAQLRPERPARPLTPRTL